MLNGWMLPSGSPASTSGRWMMSMSSSSGTRTGSRREPLGGLLGVELDDELLTDRHVDLVAQRDVADRRFETVWAHLEPGGHRPVDGVEVVADDDVVLHLRSEGDHVARSDLVRGDRDALAVDEHVAVADELAGLVATGGGGAAGTDVVHSLLEHP